MKTTNKNNKSKLIALLLSVMMFSSMGAAFASCADETDSSSSSSSSSTTTTTTDKVDNGTIKNSNFDFTTLSDTVKIGTSVTGWSRAVNSVTTGSAPSSKSASGVIDTAEDAWNDLTTRNKTDEEIALMEISDAVTAWDTLTTADKLAFYEDWQDRDENDDLDIDEEFEEYKEDSYQSFNIDQEDLPAVGMANPGIAPNQAEKDDKGNDRETDTQILMIHNNNSIGTAQKYTSSTTVTVVAGSAATFSVWVKTSGLTTVDTNKNEQDAVGKGAYIRVTQSVGGKSLDSYEVKNINTETMSIPEEDNGWKQYTFYLKGSSFADTKFSIVLGLGQSGGSDHLDYVNGYAFFDNIQYKEISSADYDTATEALNEVYLGAEKIDKIVDAYASSDDKFAMNFYKSDAGDDNNGWQNVAASTTELSPETAKTPGIKGATTNEDLYNKGKDFDLLKVYTDKNAIASAVSGNKYLDGAYTKYLDDSDAENKFLKDQDILMMLSSQGTAYTWENAYEFKMNSNYMAISFFVKTSDLGESTGLTITLTDKEKDNSTSFSSINTANLEGVTVNGIEDYYNGWQRCYFFIEKDKEIEEDPTLYLSFNYGPTSISVDTAKTSFTPGFAAVTQVETLDMSALEYECAQTGTYAQKYTLVPSEEEKAAGNSGFDTTAGTPSNAIETGLANPQNYKGVYSDSYYVNLPQSGEGIDNTRCEVNKYENAGLLNKEYFADIVAEYADNWNDAPAWLKGIAGESRDATEIWNNAFGTATQPLLIWNDGNDNRAYGYIGTSTTISSTYTAISVRVKTSGDAKASVYLVDMDDETRQSYLTVGDKLTYWYDDNGNIWTGDPTSKDSKLAFRLDTKTGLYKADKKWTGYETYKNDTFANLAAYAGYAEGAEVLYAAEDSASHSYHDYAWDRAVYYKQGDAYYTEPNGAGTKVTDLQNVPADQLARRFNGENSAELKIENIDTKGEWATVTFYIKKGNTSKNYRLEVWSSATRAGAANESGYVAFDTNNPGTASDLYSNLLEEYEDEATTKFESVFSYYDTDKHVRYDKALDTDEVGNLYDSSFTQSSYEEAIAYMLHKEVNDAGTTVRYTVFADYSLSDASVTPRAADVDDDDTETDTDTETDDDDTNVFMLISSIAVAGALFVAIGSIVGQRLWKFIKKRKAAKARVNVVKKNK